MSVSFRAVGTWAELIADGSVAIPATPQAGDRMYLFARWKDFSVTATVANWTAVPGTPFADGSLTSGNGTGSVKVGCWYRDWQSGDTDPTIDFSAAPENASVVIAVMAKEAADSWLTPVAVTAAMTNWTTTSQSVSASSTTTVLGDGVVMGLIGIRDDTATMTRPTNGIDDAGGLVTWNGNYVEAPATHHSTTTGDDGAADLGYRLVSAGAAGVTLRMTGTISAAETGAALWVVQGVEVNLTVANASHGHSAENFALTQTHNLTVASGSHAHSADNAVLTQVHEIATQDTTHAHTADSPALTQSHELVPDNATHAHAVDNVEVVQVYELVVQNAVHAHTSETPTVEVTHIIEVQDASHAHLADTLLLTQVHELVVADATHAHEAESPVVKTISIVYLDPGGDAVQVAGFPNSVVGAVSFDTTQKVVGVGSWKHDSTGSNGTATSTVAGVLGTARRVSVYFQYDSVPDTSAETTKLGDLITAYSGGGFTDASLLGDEDPGSYATATPAKNSGQGSILESYGFQESIPSAAIIDSVKIIYERKYDVDTSIGISRVKWRVDGVEGPNHDNTDMPLVDTVVEVDITGDRFWEPQDLDDTVFEIIAEARRGDTDTTHTQSWNYAIVEVVYHTAVPVLDLVSVGAAAAQLSILPKGSGVVVRFADANGDFFDGITELAPNEFHHFTFAYVLHEADNLSINVFVKGAPELSLVDRTTGGSPNITDLRYGWTAEVPGVNRVCWFDQLAIDDGDDLADPGNMLSTAKRGVTVNNDNFDTTGGTGAVNERPVNLDNYRAQVATAQVQQDYTIEAASVGDVDLSGKTVVGYMGWLIAKKVGPIAGQFGFILNGVISNQLLSTSPAFIKLPVTTSNYPDNAAGIGLRSATTSHDAFLYECGVIIAYRGPVENPPLLEFQLLAEDSITPGSDDVSVEDPTTYVIQSEVAEAPGATVTTTVFATDSAGTPHQQAVIESNGGEESGRVVVTAPGEEVSISVEVTGADAEVGLARTLNVD